MRVPVGRVGPVAVGGVVTTLRTLPVSALAALPTGLRPVRVWRIHVVRLLRAALGSNYPIIGVGGVMSGEDARAKLQAGADLVQIYTGLIYKGPELVGECARAMARA